MKLLVERILQDIEYELKKLHPVVFNDKLCGREWERSLQKYDELLIRKYQTLFILEKINAELDKKTN